MTDPAPSGPPASATRRAPTAEGTSPDAESSGADGVEPHEVDATGLSCPMPVIELAKAMEHVAIGGLVALTATDPAARVDVPVWCRMQRHLLRGMEGTDGSWRFVVERSR